ncbi:acetyl-CoA carboxylase biotin carboxylase subunit [Mesoterricola sediminis]|uniref:Acetyl-CoA carboxylase biotin carboxylase subunit n=1 Tax=Mesoterricola sediminis TaxID=2927980 RepID=A0AA48KEH4_9BACT|nr:acetyl-CoA carboxylase biotin carboxylase subunit [Mesoterricola sediminis]BDU75458.1 acetyl-CoA carboxylase biotin carboxylase subunit [Mesoterricola sediminis]
MFKKILIANRGEITIRVIRACKELGVPTVAVYSEADRAALHVRAADEAYCIGPAPSRDSYLRGDRILEVAQAAGADAIHPGYGFLSENAAFAEACAAAGITFIGPNPRAIRVMGNKTTSRVAVHEMGVPLVPGMRENLQSEAEAVAWARKIGYPIMMKAAAGGGGKGLRMILREEDLLPAYRTAKSESLAAFGDDAVYMERYIENPRHIEIQVLGDRHGNIIYCPERECSIQRRHQKVIEEAPSPIVDAEMRRAMGEAAVRAARAVDYDSAGTVEFIVSGKSREFFFLEMNTRLQVEHPITEMITGIDLCKEMIRSAAGYVLPFRQEDVPCHGHALECRIYAEDPDNRFLPTPGRIIGLRVPGGPWVRDESGMYEGLDVPIHYDPMLSKLVVWGSTRERMVTRMLRALSEYKVKGIKTTIPFHARVLRNPKFLEGDIDTNFIDREFQPQDEARVKPHEDVALVAAAIKAYRRDKAKGLAAPASGGGGDASLWKQSGRVKRDPGF